MLAVAAIGHVAAELPSRVSQIFSPREKLHLKLFHPKIMLPAVATTTSVPCFIPWNLVFLKIYCCCFCALFMHDLFAIAKFLVMSAVVNLCPRNTLQLKSADLSTTRVAQEPSLVPRFSQTDCSRSYMQIKMQPNAVAVIKSPDPLASMLSPSCHGSRYQ